jgi:nitrate/nitrite-specific signal transduction histidine kinase
MGRKAGPEPFANKVREDVRRYIQGLLQENDKRRLLAVALEAENLRLKEQVGAAQARLAQYEGERARLQAQVSEIELENRQFAEQYVQVEEQVTTLANLYVAASSLHATLSRAQVVQAILEIIANLVGSEEMALFEAEPDGRRLSLVAVNGIEPSRFPTVPFGSGIIGRAALTGRPYVRTSGNAPDPAAGEDDLTACIPLKVEGRVTGAIAIFRLLPQKAGLQPSDHELFDLLATHAATALYSARLHSDLAREVEA